MGAPGVNPTTADGTLNEEIRHAEMALKRASFKKGSAET